MTKITDLTTKVTNGGTSERGRLSADEYNTLLTTVQSHEESIASLEESTIKNCGYFSTLEALQQSYPKASAGSKAYVGASYPYAIYLWDTASSAWVDSGATGGEENVKLEDYYTKENVDEKVTELELEVGAVVKVFKNGGYFINNNGESAGYTPICCHTDYLPYRGGNIVVRGYSGESSTVLLAFYDNSKNYIGKIQDATYTGKLITIPEVYIPEGTAFVRATGEAENYIPKQSNFINVVGISDLLSESQSNTDRITNAERALAHNIEALASSVFSYTNKYVHVDGSLYDTNGLRVTPYLAYKEGDIIVKGFSGETNTCLLVFYDKDYNVLGHIKGVENNQVYVTINEKDIPSGTVCVRATGVTEKTDNYINLQEIYKAGNNGLIIGEDNFEFGSIGADGYNMNAANDWRFFKHKRTKNYLQSKKIIIGEIPTNVNVTVYEYDSGFSLLRRRFPLPNIDFVVSDDATYWRIDLVYISDNQEVTLTWEQGSLDTNGAEVDNVQVLRSNRVHISALENAEFWLNGSMLFGRVYDSNDNFISLIYQKDAPYANYRSVIENNLTTSQLGQDLYVRLLIRKDYSTSITPADLPNLLKITRSVNVVTDFPSISFLSSDFTSVKLPYRTETEEFLYSLELGGDNGEEYDKHLWLNSGKIMLPSSYSPKGKPCKVIIVCASSADYQALTGNVLSQNYMPFFQYMVKEGYAVVGFYATTGKYLCGNDGNGSPSTIIAMEQGWKTICERYNIDNSGAYVIGKSLGGLMGMASLYSNIPIKAADLLAPMMNPNDRQLGYSFASKRMYCEDCGFTNWEKLADSNAVGDYGSLPSEEYMSILRENIYKWAGYNGYWNGIVNKTMAEICETSKYNYKQVKGAYENVIKMCKVPLQIHMAEDDVNVSYIEAYNIVQAIQNGGGKARMRTMPNKTGGHYLETHENSLRVDSITTALGYTCTSIPLVYVEAISWFNRHP